VRTRIGFKTLVILFLITGCGRHNEQITEIRNSPENRDSVKHHDTVAESILSDNGKKWKVVPEMMGIIRRMENDLNTFNTNADRNGKDYKQLGERLDLRIDTLTSNCTMTGQGHDELHKWLLPFIDNTESLNNATDTSSAGKVYREMKNSFQLVNRYFE
jgi:hypothetical protein